MRPLAVGMRRRPRLRRTSILVCDTRYCDRKLHGRNVPPVITTAIRSTLVSRFPRLAKFLRALRPSSFVFTRIYRENRWKSVESRSGTGSSLARTATVRSELGHLVREFGVKAVVDAPCGDFTWMQHVDLNGAHYTGIDVVRDVIEHCRASYGTRDRRFIVGDLSSMSVPASDLIFCRDCLVHLSYRQIRHVLANFKRSGARYLLATTFPAHDDNQDIDSGSWRPLNLQQSPFNFPQPLRLILENCTDEGYEDKSLGLWRLADIDI